jgi:hypothetical protein
MMTRNGLSRSIIPRSSACRCARSPICRSTRSATPAPAKAFRAAAIAASPLLKRAQASVFKVASSGWPSKYLSKASAKILSCAIAAKSVIDERNFRSSGLPKI